MLAKIADDEALHAELAWRFVAWALPVGGQALAADLTAALATARASRSAINQEQDDPQTCALLHSAGRLSAYEREAITACVFADVIEPCVVALLESVRTPHSAHANALESDPDLFHSDSPT